ncbi:hypothetical protein [Vibrio tasmaniensis]|uniref:hypothetical protein n=1 Tax=Vibrio tasmaniensis TaxID=212663 RepID=UPI0011181689|nr:hypothetical protein [Vibrio tasmaniensis]
MVEIGDSRDIFNRTSLIRLYRCLNIITLSQCMFSSAFRLSIQTLTHTYLRSAFIQDDETGDAYPLGFILR